MDNTNLLIRDYLFIRKLGAGGMGEVWLGEDTNLERRVAIKILNPELSGDPALVARFKQEAKLQARLVHKNIVTLYNFFTEQENKAIQYQSGYGIVKGVAIYHPTKLCLTALLFDSQCDSIVLRIGIGFAICLGNNDSKV